MLYNLYKPDNSGYMKRNIQVSDATLDALASILTEAGYMVKKPVPVGVPVVELVPAIQRKLIEADHPLVQYDIVGGTALQRALALDGVIATPQQISRALREEGFRQIGRHSFGKERHYLWIRLAVDGLTAVDIAADRVHGNKTHLRMELVYG